MTPKEQKAFDEKMMAEALKEAAAALSEGEAPIGAVIVKDGEIISTGRNTRETKKTALGHAEIEAIATDRLVKLEAEGFNVVPTAQATSLTMNTP